MIEEEKGKGKKKETVSHNIPVINIKSTKIQIKVLSTTQPEFGIWYL
jgi:hypothetical protein